MKQIILKSLSLVNFKGAKDIKIDFNADVTTISGRNGIGKSRNFTAFCWLLTGKDEQDRKDYECKTRVNGVELHNVECSVTGVFLVDGETITMKRAIVENWVKPRGQVEQVYKGDNTECWWNETPVKVSDFTKRIETIIPVELFKLLTNPAYFPGMKWNLQREQLFQLAGNVSDTDIAETNADFKLLLDKLSGKSLADFKKELAARKKRLNDELNQVAPRIDQTRKMMPESKDFAAIEAELADIDKQLADVDQLMNDATAAVRAEYEAEQAKVRKIGDLKSECQRILNDANAEIQRQAFEANAKNRELVAEFGALERELSLNKKELSNARVTLSKYHLDARKKSEEQDNVRKEWFNINAGEYNGETTCPHCGQALPEEMIAKAHDIFNADKNKKLADITAKGKKLGEEIAGINALADETAKQVTELEATIKEKSATLDGLNEQIKQTPVVDLAAADPESLPDWVAKQKEIADIEATINHDCTGKVDTTEYNAKKNELNARRDALKMELAGRDAIAKGEAEIAELEAKGKQLAQQIADAEREEYTIQQFTAKKIEAVENKINGMFQFVTFKLFDYTLDGNPVEVCTPMVNGVPYGSANTAGKLNAGLDIINVLCKHYDITAPIFIDNSESINEIMATAGQQIRLVVTTDNQLIVS